MVCMAETIHLQVSCFGVIGNLLQILHISRVPSDRNISAALTPLVIFGLVGTLGLYSIAVVFGLLEAFLSYIS